MLNKFEKLIFFTEHLGVLPKKVNVSVIIVIYNPTNEFKDCLDSLKKQSDKVFEIIVLDNGTVKPQYIENYDLFYIKLKRNYGASTARNIGAELSKSNIIAFLDDDAIADKNWVKEIKKRFDKKDIVAARGKVLPKNSGNIFNLLAEHYDLGDKNIPSKLNTEGNCAVRRNYFTQIGGFNVSLYGHEGEDLYSRFIKKVNPSRIIYSPTVIIYHDYCDSLMHFLKKKFRFGKNRDKIIHSSVVGNLYLHKEHIHAIDSIAKLKLKIINILGLISEELGYYLRDSKVTKSL